MANFLKNLFRLFLVGSFLAALQACVVQPPAMPGDPYYAPVMQTRPLSDQAHNGSLYRENVALNLYGDRKAMRVGDILEVLLKENTSSSKSTNMQVKKDNKMSLPSVSGASGTVFGANPSLGNAGLGMSIDNKRETKGQADADQSNRLNGSISVTVVNVYPNGTLAIRGEKWLTLNRGDEYIRLSGLVRPDDVAPDNTVSSTKIANARIQYSGTGELADSQQMGWLARFFNSPLWPF